MNLTEYLDRKRNLLPDYRKHCHVCNRPESVCLCRLIQPFDTRTRFVILMHPKEARKQKCGTGRLCHLVLKNSRLLVGVDFTQDSEVSALIDDPDYTSVLLFPAPQAVNLSQDGYRSLTGRHGKLQIFVVDGTWSLAGKILRLSENLRALPAVSFTPRQPSNFQFKKQPRAECLSTLESIHLLLELGQEQGVEVAGSHIEQFPEIFSRLVEIQLQGADGF
ncbi:MAG: tRNA-uridine aminocarboxypropyltransferase [Luteolibacter sp.]|uniref:tRNA-uridine aminocarboxypropyltransferase n=1 Tax=Luteolibacter sp. TaxID=1962973 RepID=UPI003263E1B9